MLNLINIGLDIVNASARAISGQALVKRLAEREAVIVSVGGQDVLLPIKRAEELKEILAELNEGAHRANIVWEQPGMEQ